MGKIKDKSIDKLNSKIKTTFITDNEVTDKNYYDDHMYMTNSTLKMFMEKSPKYFNYRQNNPIVATAAMKFGTAFHMYELEGREVFEKHYAVEPDGIDKRTTIGKVTLEKFNQTLNGRDVISYKDFQLIVGMYNNLGKSEQYDLLENCNEFEKIYLWNNDTLKIKCKGKIDAINTRDKYIVDLKTTRDANPKSFKETIINQKYHMQAAFYCDALGYKDYYIYAIEKSKPHCVCVYKISKDLLAEGRLMYIQAIIDYKAYVKEFDNSRIPDYNNGQIYEI